MKVHLQQTPLYTYTNSSFLVSLVWLLFTPGVKMWFASGHLIQVNMLIPGVNMFSFESGRLKKTTTESRNSEIWISFSCVLNNTECFHLTILKPSEQTCLIIPTDWLVYWLVLMLLPSRCVHMFAARGEVLNKTDCFYINWSLLLPCVSSLSPPAGAASGQWRKNNMFVCWRASSVPVGEMWNSCDRGCETGWSESETKSLRETVTYRNR